MRIISIVPSTTETIWHLGLGKKLVGCTNFCVRPTEVTKGVVHVGGTKDADLQAIADLSPSHIVCNAEENTPEIIAGIQKIAEVLILTPQNISQVPEGIRELGFFLNCKRTAHRLADDIERELAGEFGEHLQGKRYLHSIWNDPWMVAGQNTYISSLLNIVGLRNAWDPPDPQQDQGSRYPTVTAEQVQTLGVDRLFFGTEPWPFRNRDIARIASELSPLPPCQLLDGRLLSWHGYSSLEALQELRKWSHGESNGLILRDLNPGPAQPRLAQRRS